MKPRSRGYGHSPRGRTLCGVAAASGAHPGSVLWISTLTRIEQGVNGVWIVEPALGEGARGSEPRHPPGVEARSTSQGHRKTPATPPWLLLHNLKAVSDRVPVRRSKSPRTLVGFAKMKGAEPGSAAKPVQAALAFRGTPQSPAPTLAPPSRHGRAQVSLTRRGLNAPSGDVRDDGPSYARRVAKEFRQRTLHCQECARVAPLGAWGSVAYRVDLPDEADPPEVIVYCPECSAKDSTGDSTPAHSRQPAPRLPRVAIRLSLQRREPYTPSGDRRSL